jgi:intracellular sulfur oxidation DsrE/DsrF family protein
MKAYSKLQSGIVVFIVLIVAACEQSQDKQTQINTPVQLNETHEIAIPVVEDTPVDNRQFNIDNTQYLFDVSDHSPEELEALLNRAEEIRETHAEGYDDLDIVLILHGPDINIFRQENYNKHKPVVDLAAKLDAFEIIDMKICETSMSSMGIERSEVPAFIESVPYAPDELRRLGEEGYIRL